MADFGIRFFLCNLFICAITGIFFVAKRALKNHLTGRMQFNLWFLLLGMLAVPFIPVRPARSSYIFLWLDRLKNTASPNMENIAEAAADISISGALRQMNDFALSVGNRTPSAVGLILFGIWLTGILAMLLSLARSCSRLNILRRSALPLQNREIRKLYNNCLRELKIKRNIPIYSAAFLKSPVIIGLFRPCIYLPIHLISDFLMTAERHTCIPGEELCADAEKCPCPGGYKEMSEKCFRAADMRYILLHELQHYKHKDALAGLLMNLFGILYWCNPMVWYALKEMRSDREVACDTSVLDLLDESDYEDYGKTLIDLAEKISLTPFPFAVGISGTMNQMRKRIVNISSYQKPSVRKNLKGLAVFVIFSVILMVLAPILPACAAEQDHYKWNISPEKISVVDLSAYFNGYEGSFVLYDLKNDTWSVHDMEHATLRTAPDSTYKIYDALFGLEEGIITPGDSFMAWDGTDHPFEAWNADQDLDSAMHASVNWYFQEIDERLGPSAVQDYIKEIGYGNETINGSLSSLLTNGREGYREEISPFWMQSTLKISPVEQVGLLTELYNNSFGFIPENVNAVKDSICLFSSDDKNFYGKTGTGLVDGRDVNGWFVGFVETGGNTYFFATNIQNDTNAAGSNAAEITGSVLSDLDIWK